MAHLLVIGGTDSSGGAGVHADIETIHRLGGTCSLCITAVTAQGGGNLFKSHSVPSSIVQDQLESIIEQNFFSFFKLFLKKTKFFKFFEVLYFKK